MKALFTLLFVLICISINAQMNVRHLNNTANNINNSKVVRGESNKLLINNVMAQYLLQDFQEGSLILLDGNKISNRKFNYNILNDEVQYIIEKDTFSIGNPMQIKTLQFGDINVSYTPYFLNKRIYFGYFQQFNEGKFKLLQKYKLYYVEGTHSTGYKDATPPHFQITKEYYVQKENTVAIKIKSKKALIKYFEQEGVSIQPIIKSKKIRFYKPDSLIQLFNEINE